MLREKQHVFQTLLEQLKPLTQDERWILTVIAFFEERIEVRRLNQLLNHLSKASWFKSLISQPLKLTETIQQQWAELGLIVGRKRLVEVPQVLRNHLALQCHSQGHYQQLQQHFSAEHNGYYTNRTRLIRGLLINGQLKEAENQLDLNKDSQKFQPSTLAVLQTLCFEPFDESFFHSLSPRLQYFAFAVLFASLRENSQDTQDALQWLETFCQQTDSSQDLRCLLAEQYLLRGEMGKARALPIGQSHYAKSIDAWLAFDEGDDQKALTLFGEAIKSRFKVARSRGQYISRLPGLFYNLTLLKLASNQDAKYYADFDKSCDQFARLSYGDFQEIDSYRQLKQFSQSLRTVDCEYQPMVVNNYRRFVDRITTQMELLIDALCCHWSNIQPSNDTLDVLAMCFNNALNTQNYWYCQIAAQLLYHYNHNAQAQAFLEEHPVSGNDLLQLMRKKERWQQGLDQLIALNRPATEQLDKRQQRLIWWVDVRHWPFDVTVGIQSMGKKSWLKPKAITYEQLLKERDTMDFLSMEDEKLIQLLKQKTAIAAKNSYYKNPAPKFSGHQVLAAAMGHPALYKIGDWSAPISIRSRNPELQISQSGSGFKLTMPVLTLKQQMLSDIFDDTNQQSDFVLTEEGNNKFGLIHFDGVLQEIADIVGIDGLRAPLSAKTQVIESIKAIAPFLNIQSNISGIDQIDTGMKTLNPDSTLYLNIHNIGPGFQVQVQVQPLGPQGPTLKPGVGNSMIVEKINQVRTATNRDLKREKSDLQLLVKQIPMFQEMVENLVQLDELEESLTCLEQLHNHQDSGQEPKVVLQWLKGQPIRVSKTISTGQMTVKTDKKADWFSLTGQLKVSKDEVLELKQVLDALDNSQSRFIPIGDDTYIALTKELKRQLHMIHAVSYREKYHPLAVPVIEQACTGMVFKSDGKFNGQLTSIKQSFELAPKLPSTLQAELRDYQKEGFDWAVRLAHWGAGACLADDMGLGKTLQALAVILHRAADGPTLVVSPTSVCFNWYDETRRFAPTLNPIIYGQLDKAQRKEILNTAKPFDLIILSYGLLQNDIEHLAKTHWRTIVADEAQALKNPRAKRTLAANQLKGDFRLITTGTPVENNLTELWSLFNFINPGLLGSARGFNEQFISKIESFDSKAYVRKAANLALKQRIGPFVLRRLKSQVLTELPSRTEIKLNVELGYEQQAFYEALRQKAVDTLLEKVKDEQPQQKRLRILAELMKLRRACCAPELVEGGEKMAGAKLKVFDELLDELLANNHKSLVFSQFVDHLAILRKHLDSKGISYQYLDGGTTAKQRQKAVNAFQSGDGDVFLISLKAGGFGLNLTAADYVIHMDPWWNPAVEDQASDRAHRLGQTRPVTIYRLICQNTIEDKIMSLHQRKRDLADGLLSGSDSNHQLSLEDLMALMN